MRAPGTNRVARLRLRRLALAGLAVGGGVIATFSLLDRDSGSADRGILPREDFVTSYRVVYDVEEFDTPGRIEERIVERPYHSKVLSRRGSTVLGGSITNSEGRWVLLPDGESWQLRGAGRQRPPDDLRPIDALETAAEDGRAVGRGSDVVLGRRCTVVRVGGLPGSAIDKPTAEDFTDLCIDRTGVVLRERWVVGGQQARLMVATSFMPDARIDPGEFEALPEAEHLPEGVAGLERVRDLSAGEPLPLAEPVRAAEGFRPDQPPVAVEREIAGRGLETIYRLTFVRDGRLVVVDQGVASAGSTRRGRGIELAAGVEGRLELGLTASTITVVTSDGVYVRFRGSDLEVLRAFAADLAERLS